jgi:hypothetical protein
MDALPPRAALRRREICDKCHNERADSRMHRTVRLNVNMPTDEYLRYKGAAASCGQTLSEFVRAALQRGADDAAKKSGSTSVSHGRAKPRKREMVAT